MSQNGVLPQFYVWVFLARVGSFWHEPGSMSSRNQTTVARNWEGPTVTPAFAANTAFTDWIYMSPSEHLAVLGPQGHVLLLCPRHLRRETTSCVYRPMMDLHIW